MELTDGGVWVVPKHEYRLFKIQDAENANEIKSLQVELEKCRANDMDNVTKSVAKMRGDLENLKVDLRKNFVTESQNYFKTRMLDIQREIRRLKEVIKDELFTLLKDEADLMKDLEFSERRMEDCIGKSFNSQTLRPIRQSLCKISNNGSNPAAEFQKFLLSSGGHCGGWHEQDHMLFLRVRKKFKGKEKFISAVRSLLPDFSGEEIAEHEKWYLKYESLKNFQKEAIQKWKSERAIRQEKEKATEEEEEKTAVSKPVRQQRHVAERIKEWKNQQTLRKLEEEERQKAEKKLLREEERKKRELQEKKKIQVNQYKAWKLSRLKQEVFSKEKQQAAQEAKVKKNILLKAFRLQDVKFIERKKTIRLEMESKPERLRLTKPAIEVILRRDPQRIFQPTLIWSQHCLEAQKREKIDPVFNLNAIPRLAIPEWRRELK